MEALFANGQIVDLILGLMVLEALALTGYRRATGAGIAAGDLLASLMAGAMLLLALRAALAGAYWQWVALCLVLSLLAHLGDLRRRWRTGPKQPAASLMRTAPKG